MLNLKAEFPSMLSTVESMATALRVPIFVSPRTLVTSLRVFKTIVPVCGAMRVSSSSVAILSMQSPNSLSKSRNGITSGSLSVKLIIKVLSSTSPMPPSCSWSLISS